MERDPYNLSRRAKEFNPEIIGKFVRYIAPKVEIAMVLMNRDGSVMNALEFEKTVASDERLFLNLTDGGTKPLFPVVITMKCGCVYELKPETWPKQSQLCQHKNIFVKIN